MNYKVKVNNEAESREVEVYFDILLGGANICKEYDVYDKYPRFVFGNKEFINTWTMVNWNKIDNKELTIQQLRDLVVLKRNDKSDRNVIDPEEDASLYLDSDNKLFVFHLPTQTWKESNLNGEEEVMERLKPITKPLKEYLKIYDDGSCVLMDGAGYSGQDNWHDVTGADWAYKNSRGKIIAMNGEIGDSFGRDLVWKRDKDEVMKEYLVPQDNGKYALTKATEKRVSDWVEVPEGAEAATFCKNEGVNY